MTDRKKLEAERKEIIEKILRIQKDVTEKDLHVNPSGVLKEYKEEHEKLANRLVDIAHELKGSIRT